MIDPIHAPSLREVFIARFEKMILSGEFAVGERLPSERDLAAQLGVSRPVVHDGLLELQARGLVTMRPRHGTVVNDFRTQGSLALLVTLIEHGAGTFDARLMRSMLDFRHLIEGETARRAASMRTGEDLAALRDILRREGEADQDDVDAVVALDFEMHHRVAMASGNVLYPMLLKSFEPAYTNLTGIFFRIPDVTPVVFDFHVELTAAIEAADEDAAERVMYRLLQHGETILTRALKGDPTHPGERPSRPPGGRDARPPDPPGGRPSRPPDVEEIESREENDG